MSRFAFHQLSISILLAVMLRSSSLSEVTEDNEVDFKTCPGSESNILHVYVSDCNRQEMCAFQNGKKATVAMDFVPSKSFFILIISNAL